MGRCDGFVSVNQPELHDSWTIFSITWARVQDEAEARLGDRRDGMDLKKAPAWIFPHDDMSQHRLPMAESPCRLAR